MKLEVIVLMIFLPTIITAQNSGWSYWNKSNEDSLEIVNHSGLSLFLDKYVDNKDGMNLVKYKDVTENDEDKLEKYINYLSGINVTGLNKLEQKVYWINLYNSLTIKVVLDHYPVKSIRDIKLSGFFVQGPWKKKLVRIENNDVSLDDIEHRILRPIWQDKRVHYALNCASIGCPPLQNRAFTASTLNNVLTSIENSFVNSRYGVSIKANKVEISSIYKWFSKDFGNSEEEIILYIESVLIGDKKEEFRMFKNNIIYKYNWNLNEF